MQHDPKENKAKLYFCLSRSLLTKSKMSEHQLLLRPALFAYKYRTELL